MILGEVFFSPEDSSLRDYHRPRSPTTLRLRPLGCYVLRFSVWRLAVGAAYRFGSVRTLDFMVASTLSKDLRNAEEKQ